MDGVDWTTVVSTIIGAVIGGLVNWFFSRRSSKQLRKEANHLHRGNIMLLRLLEQAGVLTNIKWDEHGEPLMEVGNEINLRWNVKPPENQENQETP